MSKRRLPATYLPGFIRPSEEAVAGLVISASRKTGDKLKKIFRRVWFVMLWTIPSVLSAGVVDVRFEGTFDVSDLLLIGAAYYRLAPTSTNELLFHLPPNWQAAIDRRETYRLRDRQRRPTTVSRSELDTLNAYVHPNAHLPNRIVITQVEIDQRPVRFRIEENPALLPRLNAEGALLAVDLPRDRPDDTILVIHFETRFRSLPRGYQPILWDFMPRPVVTIGGVPDMRGLAAKRLPFSYDLRIWNQTPSDRPEVLSDSGWTTVPVLMAGRWNEQHDGFWLSIDNDLSRQIDVIRHALNRALGYLIDEGWIDSGDEPFRFLIWDGGTTVADRTVLLPRRLFRYAFIFGKLFEIEAIKGIVEAETRRRYRLDSFEEPWIIPAIQGEVIRSYLMTRYGGNTLQFPWLDWLNPDYLMQENIKTWIENRAEKTVTGADSPLEWSLYSDLYHPGRIKGFHLLCVMHDGRSDYTERSQDRLKRFLRADVSAERTPWSGRQFIQAFATDPAIVRKAEAWLSAEGSIDYAIRNVNVLKNETVWVEFEIVNHGTVSPALVVEITLADGTQKRWLFPDGAGIYRVPLAAEPEQIRLDPDRCLLENDILNNSWKLPIKIRPVWDFPAADHWVFAIAPYISGNTFDQNLIGLNLSLSFMKRTELKMTWWRRSKDETVLWDGSLTQRGFPFRGSEWYWYNSELNARSSRSIGFKQLFLKWRGQPWLDLMLWDEQLQAFDGLPLDDDAVHWSGLRFETYLPAYRAAFYELDLNLVLDWGVSRVNPGQTYRQQSAMPAFRFQLGAGADFHLSGLLGLADGEVPVHKAYALGGPEALPGFPRESDLLFYQAQWVECGFSLPSALTHNTIHLLRLLWLQRVVPIINVHWGKGYDRQGRTSEDFWDLELQLDLVGAFIDMYVESAKIAIAQPLYHDRYRDYRIILASSWVF
jgi:hypothetical protein